MDHIGRQVAGAVAARVTALLQRASEPFDRLAGLLLLGHLDRTRQADVRAPCGEGSSAP